MTTRADIVGEARAWVGVPYLHQGRTRAGTDCGGLIGGVAVARGVIPATWWADVFDPQFGGYGRRPTHDTLRRICRSFMHQVETAEPGDVLLMRFKREPQHLAICCGGTVVHALNAVGKVCEHGFTERWRGLVVEVYRMPGVTE